MTVAATAIVVVALVGGSMLLVTVQRRALTHDVESAARLRATELSNLLADGTLPGELTVPGDDSSFAQIVDLGSGAVVSASANLTGEPRLSPLVPALGSSRAQTVDKTPFGGGKFRLVARRVSVGRHQYVVYAGSSLQRVDDSTSSLAWSLLLGLPALVVLIGATTWLVVGRALRPVEAIRKEVAEISEHELHRRVPESSSHDEIGRLARTMNAMLERVDDANERQRRFVADASHELRSPLTGIRSELEVDLRASGSR